jgi:tetratricopeptide (TPR) repeat protein
VTAVLSPDRLAALEEERDFLLRSLADLEAERAAGDIDEADYQALTDDYTARTAEVLRAIDEHRDAVEASRPARSPGRLVAIVAAVAVVAVLAGVLMAQASGRRQPGDTITGDAPRTATQEARACLELTAAQRPGEAVECYRDVLDRDADNPTALTYLAWTLYLASGGLEEADREQAVLSARGFLDRAIDVAPDFADAYAFRAVVAFREGRVDDAAADLDRLDELDPPASVREITGPLRAEVDRAQRTTTTTAPP